MTSVAPTSGTARATLCGDESELFAVHHHSLLRAVRRIVRANEAVIEDACAHAWLVLLRRQPDRGARLFGWLRTVAVHEAYRLLDDRGVVSLETLTGDGGDGWETIVAGRQSVERTVEARQALAVLARLPAAQRHTLALFVAGYRYEEIGRLRGVSYSSVNKRLVRARQRMRQAA